MILTYIINTSTIDNIECLILVKNVTNLRIIRFARMNTAHLKITYCKLCRILKRYLAGTIISLQCFVGCIICRQHL